MAVVDPDANPLHLRWRLTHRFLPFVKSRVSFFHNRPLPLKWTATLRPTRRSTREWGVVFFLRCSDEESEYEDFAVVADSIEIKISATHQESANQQDVSPEGRFVFSGDNNYTFRADVIAVPAQSRLIVVEAVVHFQARSWGKMDLEGFSKDLATLLYNTSYSEFCLASKDPTFTRPVHFCIMEARWPSLSYNHPDQFGIGATVPTDLPPTLLDYILTYMYTGKDEASIRRRIRNNRSTELELRKAIEKYELGHIERLVYNRPTTFHQYETISGTCSIQFSLRLGITESRENLQVLTNVRVSFHIRFALNHPVPHFRSQIRIQFEGPLYIRVICRYEEQGVTRHVLFEFDRVVLSNENLTPHPILISGRTPEMRVFLDRCRRGEDLQDIERRLVVHIILSKGIQMGVPETLESPEPVEFNYGLMTLSDDILRHFDNEFEVDLEVLCGRKLHNLHRAIIAARVPKWLRVFRPHNEEEEPVAEGDLIPPQIVCHLSSVAFQHILEYIYSGRVFPCSERYYDEIYNFAFESEMFYLAAIWLLRCE